MLVADAADEAAELDMALAALLTLESLELADAIIDEDWLPLLADANADEAAEVTLAAADVRDDEIAEIVWFNDIDAAYDTELMYEDALAVSVSALCDISKQISEFRSRISIRSWDWHSIVCCIAHDLSASASRNGEDDSVLSKHFVLRCKILVTVG